MGKLSFLPLAIIFANLCGGKADAVEQIVDGNMWCSRYHDCASCVAYSLPSYARRLSLEGADPSVFDRIMNKERCGWDCITSTCKDISTSSSEEHIVASMQECRPIAHLPEEPAPWPPNILPDWMGTLHNMTDAFGDLTLLDISLPGTHDTLTYDLSLEISDDGLDFAQKLDTILHAVSGGTIQLLPDAIETFLRDQSTTQRLSIVDQLNSGIRFLDIRIMMEAEGRVWFGQHFMQTYHPALYYLQQVREWLDEHPTEIVVLWLSKHGVTQATGESQYPGVSTKDKQAFWIRYCNVFEGLLLDTAQSSLNTTFIENLIERNHRVVTFATDYAEFTNSSRYALDGALINNFVRGDGAFEEAITLSYQRGYFQEARANNDLANVEGRFNLMGMNTEGTENQILGALKDRFLKRTYVETEFLSFSRSLVAHASQLLGILGELGLLGNDIYLSGMLKKCSDDINIPGIRDWCPATLLDIAELSSFYDQVAIEEAFLSAFVTPNFGEPQSAAFPHAFYLDGVDIEGTIRTGTWSEDQEAEIVRYAFADTVISYNTEIACSRTSDRDKGEEMDASGCYTLRQIMADRRLAHPLLRWDDEARGRHKNWPP